MMRAPVELSDAQLDGPSTPRTVAVIQARTGSTRFPAKVLADLGGRPMLAHVIERVSRATMIDAVVVATTVSPADDAVASLAIECGALVTRGPVNDVLARYLIAAAGNAADVVVRITADCPLIDPVVIDSVVRARAEAGADYASNVEPPTFPEGYDVEVITAECLRRLDREAVADYEREHVTARIRERPDEYRTAEVLGNRDLSSIRLTVDVPEDLSRVRAILSALPASPPPDLAAVVAYFQTDSSLADQSRLPSRNERYRAQRDLARSQEASE